MYLHFLDNLHSKLLFVFNLNVFIIDRDKSWSFLFEAVFRGYLFICVLVCQVNKSHGHRFKRVFYHGIGLIFNTPGSSPAKIKY
jgi:hypothetical protein